MQTARGSLSIKDLFVSFITKHAHGPAQSNRDVSDGIVLLGLPRMKPGPPNVAIGVEERRKGLMK